MESVSARSRGDVWRRVGIAGVATIIVTVAVVAVSNSASTRPTTLFSGMPLPAYEEKPVGFLLRDDGKVYAYQRLSRRHAELQRIAEQQGPMLPWESLASKERAKQTAADFFGEGRPADKLRAPFEADNTADYGLITPMNPDEYDEISKYVTANTDVDGKITNSRGKAVNQIIGI